MCQFCFMHTKTILLYLDLAMDMDDADCYLLWYFSIMHVCITQTKPYTWTMGNRTVRSVVSTVIVIIKEWFWFNSYTMLTTAGRNRSRFHLYVVSIACQTGFSIILPLVPFVNEVLPSAATICQWFLVSLVDVFHLQVPSYLALLAIGLAEEWLL